MTAPTVIAPTPDATAFPASSRYAFIPSRLHNRDTVPMKRYGTSAEIAATVSFLASDGAGYITGQNILIDGGMLAKTF